jgi:hypothetical protein
VSVSALYYGSEVPAIEIQGHVVLGDYNTIAHQKLKLRDLVILFWR